MRVLSAFLVAGAATLASGTALTKKHHHKKHHKKHAAKHTQQPAAVSGVPVAPSAPAVVAPAAPTAPETKAVVQDLKKLASTMEAPSTSPSAAMVTTTLDVAGPITPDFPVLFSNEASAALNKTGVKVTPAEIKVTGSKPSGMSPPSGSSQIMTISFVAPAEAAHQIKVQASTEGSPLATGALEKFLSMDDSESAGPPPAPDADKGLEIDGQMPFGELEPFGREDTANELTADSIKESDAMVDQMERAEVAEEKRSVFRALTRLRGAAITSFDGVARSQTGQIDEYNHTHQWRKEHPVKHLAAEEADSSKWAFPSHKP